MRALITTLMLTATFSALPLSARQTAPAASAATRAAAEEAIGGLDAVRLVQGQEVDGRDDLAVTHHGLVYYFATAETKAAFEREPARYAVQLDGMCARMGPPVEGAQALHTVHEGRVYVFGSPDCQKLFVANPARFLDRTPSPLAGLAADAAARGRTLLDRAVAAHGGADAITRVTGFHERTTQQLETMRGPATVVTDTTTLLPNRWRQETSNQYGQFLLVVTPEAAFRGSSRAAPRPMSESLRTWQRARLNEHPLALLRASRTGDLRVGALDAATTPAGTPPRVAIEHDGETVIVTLDAAGRLHGLTTRAHSPKDGAIATIVRTLSDYRTVGALTLPFRVETTIDGVASPELSYTVESLDLDPVVDAAALAKPLEARP
jgi:YHS domain-containing protein